MADKTKISWTWLSKWEDIGDQTFYLCCAIGKSDDGSKYMYRPEVLAGWQVKQRREGCYMATEWFPPCPDEWPDDLRVREVPR